MHSILGPANKKELNNLITFEHKRFEELLCDPLISSSGDSILKRFDIETSIPRNVPAI